MKRVILFLFLIFTVAGCLCFVRFYKENKSFSTYVFKENTNLPSQEALGRFSGGLKIKTISNPEYHKTDFQEFDKFISYIKESYPAIIENCEFNRVNNYAIVIKLKGQNPDNLPNILIGHYDVVGIKNAQNWKFPPFSGHFDNEYVYSRGTIDDKSAVFAILEALEGLMNEGFKPKNDLYIAFSHAEETGSVEGAPKIIEYFKRNNIKFNSVLDEGGRIVNEGGNYYAFIGTAEKGRLLSKVTVYGKPFHASSPDRNTAVNKLAKLIQAFSKNKNKAVISQDIKQYYKTTYKSQGHITRFLISNLEILKPIFVRKISNNAQDRARISSTYAITIIEASNIQNAVSSDASMLIDSRIIPEETTEDVKEYINKIIKKTLPGEKVKIEYLNQMEPSVSKIDNKEEFEKLSAIIRKIYPNILVSPYLTLGATDAREYNNISNNTFRFLPCILKEEEASLMHGDNEKISIKNWGRMITFYREYILSR